MRVGERGESVGELRRGLHRLLCGPHRLLVPVQQRKVDREIADENGITRCELECLLELLDRLLQLPRIRVHRPEIVVGSGGDRIQFYRALRQPERLLAPAQAHQEQRPLRIRIQEAGVQLDGAGIVLVGRAPVPVVIAGEYAEHQVRPRLRGIERDRTLRGRACLPEPLLP